MTAKPSIGRIVHFAIEANVHFAAIVTQVHDGHDGQRVDLTVFPPWSPPYLRHSVDHAGADGPKVGCWHWPERVE